MRDAATPSWPSRVRGLLLGLALGDALGASAPSPVVGGQLSSGVATQLAAWTVETMLRSATRYGHIFLLDDIVRYGLQRWVLLRGGQPGPRVMWNPVIESDHNDGRGWLMQVPAMALSRGSSPATWRAVTTGQPVPSTGCQGMLRCLPLAALIDRERSGPGLPAADLAGEAASVCRLTHDHPQGVQAAIMAVTAAAACLGADRAELAPALQRVFAGRHGADPVQVDRAWRLGQERPGHPQVLRQVAPDATGMSAVAGGLYTALSYPEPSQVEEALQLAVTAPDPDSVTAVCGALVGALHGYEALPVGQVSRLELGWVMDRLATDLVVELDAHQSGPGWKSEGPDEPVLDPWWQHKYPGV